MPLHALSDKDVNAPVQTSMVADPLDKSNVKSMEYHRQVFQNKIAEEKTKQYISPSDNIMSPCTAKLNAFRNKKIGKAKPKSLFAQASSKKLDGEPLFGAKSPSPTKPDSTP
ncbi:hypothetical protein SODALDRAFT_332617 [Sodiomyces alkalinus F11]|uniref:Spo12-like protein n=1 Tax=Sodiomyces alkalinus (strain CBS 110278 / VKM F-3762 / F11) TaxID=1314773 RepID=A0A3N2PXJ8_SODAK|nr:hypothetical protein SODALDRAFT_332617 [Sodiomyces alkalinus F11]ROT39194.1 hypothetical protein SODALDRAFT_332617 [Sodiomyces alkalinus F11]